MNVRILFLLVILLITTVAFGISTDSLVSYYTTDTADTNGTDMIDVHGTRNGTISGASSTGGRLGEAYQMSPDTDHVVLHSNYDVFNGTSNFTIALWINVTSFNDNEWIMSLHDEKHIQINLRTNNQLQCLYHQGANQIARSSNLNLTLNAWNLIGCSYSNTGGITAWVDSVEQDTDPTTGTITSRTASSALNNDDNLLGNGINAVYDEVSIWGRELNQTDWNDLYNNGTGLAYPFAAGPETNYTVSILSPTNGTIFNTQNITVTAVINATGVTDGVSLNISPSPLVTSNATYTSNATATEVSWSLNFTSTDVNTYIWNVSIENVASNNSQFIIDNIDVNITNNLGVNFTIYKTLALNFTLADENLYAYYLNITAPNGSVTHQLSNATLTGVTEYNITDIIDLSSSDSGVWQLDLKAQDGHTAKFIPNLLQSIDYGAKSFNYGVVQIRDTAPASVTGLWDEKHYDRHKFGYVYDALTLNRQYRVICTSPIDILNGKTSYRGHLVCGDRWIDFEHEKVQSVTVDRISSHVVLVNVAFTEPVDAIQFDSTGVLNTNTFNTTFFLINSTHTAVSPVLAGTSNTFTLSYTYNATYASTYSATLYYNNTAYTPTETSNITHYHYTVDVTTPIDTANHTFYWNFTQGSTVYNTSEAIQEVYRIGLDDCSTYTSRWVNFSVADELTAADVSATMDYAFEYGIGVDSQAYNGSDTTAVHHDFCFTPDWAEFNTSVLIQYAATGYDERDYIQQAYIVNNQTENITLYLLNSTQSTEVTFHVVDDADNNLNDVLIEAYKYDVSTNSDVLVETEETDNDGNAILNLQTGDTYYSFKFYQEGVLVLSTTRFKLFSTSYEYIIRSTLTSPLADFLQLDSQTDSTLTYDNGTRLVNFTWAYSGSTVSQFCLTVDGNGTEYNNQCSTNANGSLTYTITDLNVTYVAVGKATLTNGNTYNLHILGIDTRTNLSDILDDDLALLIAFFVFLLITMLFLVNKTLAVVGGTLSIIVLWMFGILPIGWTVMLGAIGIGVITLLVVNRR